MKNVRFFFSCICLVMFCTCTDRFLNTKPSKDLVVPSTLADFQALLDRISVMNDNTAGLQTLSVDNFVLRNDQYLLGSYVAAERNAYIWNKEIFEDGKSIDWDRAYLAIFYANVVLEGLATLDERYAQNAEHANLKGSALFYRAYSYYHLVQMFAVPYDNTNETNSLGVPLRTSANVNDLVLRPLLNQNYALIINDLEEAVQLLPAITPYSTRPSKVAALALLARTYLSMSDYDKASYYADEALSLHPYLIDYNTLDASSPAPFPLALPNGNDEVIFYASTGAFGFFYNSETSVDTELYNTYHTDDLRRSVFFAHHDSGTILFKGNYSGTSTLFGGLASDELYLTKAESLTRLGEIDNAVAVMDRLLITRYRHGLYQPIAISGQAELLEFILLERRKQLLGRGIRWTDLRRLNKYPDFQKTITRSFQGEEYTLLPNDKRYVFPIPEDEISSSGIEQNER